MDYTTEDVYFVAGSPTNGTYGGGITRYDTTLSFTSAGSYSFFDTATVSLASKGFSGGVLMEDISIIYLTIMELQFLDKLHNMIPLYPLLLLDLMLFLKLQQ